MDISLKTDLIKQIKRYQNYISSVDPPENDASKILHYIRKLAKLPIELEELEKTGVGKTINALRKRNGSIGEEATALVAKWKSIVKKQVNDQDGEEEEEKADEPQKKKKSKEEPHSGHLNKRNFSNDYGELDSKHHVKKVENQNTSEQKFELKGTHLITLKNRNKRKHSDAVENIEEKYMKMNEDGSRELCSNLTQSKSDNVDVSPNKTDSVSSHSDVTNIDLDKRKKKEELDDKKHKREHEKRHKTSKHSKKSDRHHRHHSKSSNHGKKRDEQDAASSRKRHDKESKSRNKDENKKQDRKHETKRKSSLDSESKPSGKKSKNMDVANVENDVEIGDDFGAALLNIPHTVSTNKKRSSSKSSTCQDSLHSPSSQKSISSFDLFSNNLALEPLDLDDDLRDTNEFYSSPNKNSQTKSISQLIRSEDEMLNAMIVTKNQRTKVYSGNKCAIVASKFPTLFELCARVLQENFDALEYTGGVPYDVLKPILEKVTVQQLYTFENYNPYLIGETDDLWEYHAKKEFRKAQRMEYETWRDLYLRCVEEREERFQSLTENIKEKELEKRAPVRKTKLAYIDDVVKPPRNVARSQAKYGTGHVSSRTSPKNLLSSPTAGQSVKDRLVKEAMAPNAIQVPSKSNSLVKKKKAPLMQKTLQLFKGLKR